MWSNGLVYAQFGRVDFLWGVSLLCPNPAATHKSLGDVEGLFPSKIQDERGLFFFLDLYGQFNYPILQQAHIFPGLLFAASSPVEALYVAFHVLQLQLQPGFGFPYSTPLLKY